MADGTLVSRLGGAVYRESDAESTFSNVAVLPSLKFPRPYMGGGNVLLFSAGEELAVTTLGIVWGELWPGRPLTFDEGDREAFTESVRSFVGKGGFDRLVPGPSRHPATP